MLVVRATLTLWEKKKMTYEEALKVAKKNCPESQKSSLNTKRQRRKFLNGFGRVRMYAGLPHSRVAK